MAECDNPNLDKSLFDEQLLGGVTHIWKKIQYSNSILRSMLIS